MFPQAVYFPIRILFLTLRTVTARNTNTAQQQQASQEAQSGDTSNQGKYIFRNNQHEFKKSGIKYSFILLFYYSSFLGSR